MVPDYTQTDYNSLVTYTCVDGMYYIGGEDTVQAHCQADGEWTTVEETCAGTCRNCPEYTCSSV